MTLSIPFLLALMAAPEESGPPPRTGSGVTAPLDQPRKPVGEQEGSAPVAAPLDEGADPQRAGGAQPHSAPAEVPLEVVPGAEGTAHAPQDAVAVPLGEGPPEVVEPEVDPRTTSMVRVDAMVGPVFRVRHLDAMVTTSIEYGRTHGFSGALHTTIIVVPDRDVVRVLDVPIGVGALWRGRLRKRPLYGSVGLSAGVLVHRAVIDGDVTHRVDPDFRVPIRAAWTFGKVGASLAIVQGYSVRNRTYERRGFPVWERHAYRIGLVLGLHLDLPTGRARKRRPAGG